MTAIFKISFDSWLKKDCFVPHSEWKQNTNDINEVDIIKRYTVIKNMLLKGYHRSNMVAYWDILISMLMPNLLDIVIVATTSLRMTNNTLSKLIDKVSHMDYKRTWQGVPNALLLYLYNRYMVHAHDKHAYPNVHVLSISLPHCFHKVNMFSDIIVLNSSTIFQTYDLISCDTSCDCNYLSLHCLRKQKQKQNKTKLKIKSKKIKKTKRK